MAGGYELLKACLAGRRTRDEMIKTVERCRAARPWRRRLPLGPEMEVRAGRARPAPVASMATRASPGPSRTAIISAGSASVPRRHADRRLGRRGARTFIYLRDEYPALRLILLNEIATLEHDGLVAPRYLDLRRGAGAYICGEESAMIELIEGKRGLPRHRPPYVAQVGIFGRPTLVHNVETLFWIRRSWRRARPFPSQGRRHKGIRSFSVSGRVKAPGVVLAPAGTTANELIERFPAACWTATVQGLPARRCLGRHPAGEHGRPAARFRPAREVRLLRRQPCGCDFFRPGRMKAVAVNLLRFLRGRICGQCTPCRVGSEKAVKLMAQGPGTSRCSGSSGQPWRRLDLRPWPGGAEPDAVRDQLFPGGSDEADEEMVTLTTSKDQKPVGYATTQGAAGGDNIQPEPGTTHTGRWRASQHRQGQIVASRLMAGRSKPRRRDHLAGGEAPRHNIPHLCYAPEPGYRADGNCRACMVEVEGERVLAASCIRKPAPA